MASPQKEHGHTQIANELFEAILRADLTLREMKIILTIIRFTYGFNRKEHRLSVRFISNATGIKYQHIAAALKSLHNKNLISFSAIESHSQSRMIKLNKDYETWLENRNRKSDGFLVNSHHKGYGSHFNRSQKSDGTVTERVTETVTERVTKKEIYKNNLKKKFNAEDFEKFWEFFPNGHLGNKGCKKKALSEFLKIDPEIISLQNLINAVQNQAEYKKSMLSQKQFVPQFQNVERWLKNERWADEIPELTNEITFNPIENVL